MCAVRREFRFRRGHIPVPRYIQYLALPLLPRPYCVHRRHAGNEQVSRYSVLDDSPNSILWIRYLLSPTASPILWSWPCERPPRTPRTPKCSAQLTLYSSPKSEIFAILSHTRPGQGKESQGAPGAWTTKRPAAEARRRRRIRIRGDYPSKRSCNLFMFSS